MSTVVRDKPDTTESAALQPLEYPGRTTKVRIFLEEDLFAPEVVERLRVIADHNRLEHPVVGLPDIHYKVGNFIPTGTALATGPDRILPCAIGNGTGCGFSALRLDRRASDLAPGEVHEIFTRLMDRVPIRRNDRPLSPREVDAALAEGLDGVPGLTEADRARVDFHGNMFRDLDVEPDLDFRRWLPPGSYDHGAVEMGILAAGNHFIELVEVTAVTEPQVAAWFGVREGDLFLTLHADGNRLCSIGKTFTPYKTFRDWDRTRQELAKIAFHLRFYGHPFFYPRQDELFTLPVDSRAGRRFVTFCKASANFGFLNRHRLRGMVGEVLGSRGVGSELFLDSIHDALSLEDGLWVHRTGASVARPAASHDDPAHRRYGKPLLLPCAMGLGSFLMVPGPRVGEAYGSVNHGTGRIIDRTKVDAYTRADIDRSLSERQVGLYAKGTFNLAREHADTFKDPGRVRALVEGLGLATVFAELRPLAVMKG